MLKLFHREKKKDSVTKKQLTNRAAIIYLEIKGLSKFSAINTELYLLFTKPRQPVRKHPIPYDPLLNDNKLVR